MGVHRQQGAPGHTGAEHQAAETAGEQGGPLLPAGPPPGLY